MKIKLGLLLTVTIAVAVVLGSVGKLGSLGSNKQKRTPQSSTPNQPPLSSPSEITGRLNIALPADDFLIRITKKPFGIYITPENSPVQPERFAGFHTGADVEYEDIAGEVAVYAVCDGEIVETRRVTGYGGAVAQKCELGNQVYFLIYGHLAPDSLNGTGPVEAGEQIGILGQGYSPETDGERKHLHLGIHKETLDWRGYVQTEAELAEWEDPVEFFRISGR